MLNLDRYVRCFLSGEYLDIFADGHIVCSMDFVSKERYWLITSKQKRHVSLQEAMADLDQRLIEQGYILLTEKQALLI
jgi:hypothetical protein